MSKSTQTKRFESDEIICALEEITENLEALKYQLDATFIDRIYTQHNLRLATNIVSVNARKIRTHHYLKDFLKTIIQQLNLERTIRNLEKDLEALKFSLNFLKHSK
ncbi:MAG: hypothetical protein UR60_C0036G0012 [Candidatus Moranbacteria bacterium GW2011_GWF2_34_56]|nr:MAG: hypothetical protein UR51_C0009G0107 [Candidatus Moranbacteria bacterium GW2011_GWF1_34_10]KKP63879.1 MAG: hypothetical protein UR60_C0036G0012 [Candidatus Moranbacteria bacterium GW2011_GWF2_34_56]HBI17403.1 hypothetical protein [Candidatus Moranbacteria bacterium]